MRPPHGSTATFSGEGVCGPRSLLLGLRASGRCVMHVHLSCLPWVLPGQPKEAERGPRGVGRGPIHRQLSRFSLQGQSPTSLAITGSRLSRRIPGGFSVLDQPAPHITDMETPRLPPQKAIKGHGDMRRAAARVCREGVWTARGVLTRAVGRWALRGFVGPMCLPPHAGLAPTTCRWVWSHGWADAEASEGAAPAWRAVWSPLSLSPLECLIFSLALRQNFDPDVWESFAGTSSVPSVVNRHLG